jgi:hypothetical protein
VLHSNSTCATTTSTLLALGKLDVVAAAVAPSGWVALAEAVGRNTSELHRDVSSTLNSLSKLDAAAAAMSPSGWSGLAEAVKSNASEMNPQGRAIQVERTLNPKP